MAQLVEPLGDRVLIFSFLGGPDDGVTIRFDPPHRRDDAAHVFWEITQMGTVGFRFHWWAGDRSSQCYEIVSRQDTSDEIAITCEHIAGG